MHDAIVTGSALVLALGIQSDAEAAVNWCAHAISCTLTENERAALIARVSPAEAAVDAMSSLFAMITPEERLDLWQRIKADKAVAPGSWLAKTLAGNRMRNVGRDPERSDSITREQIFGEIAAEPQ
jgi:Trp operon repressor